MTNIILDSIAKLFSKKETTENLIEELEKDKQKLEYLLVHVNLLKKSHKNAFDKTHIKDQRFLIMNQLKGLVHEMYEELEKINKNLPKKIDFENIKEHEEEITKFNKNYEDLIEYIKLENEYHIEIFNEIKTEKNFEEKEEKLKKELENSLINDESCINDINELIKNLDELIKSLKNDLQNNEIYKITKKIREFIEKFRKKNLVVIYNDKGTTLINEQIIDESNFYKIFDYKNKKIKLLKIKPIDENGEFIDVSKKNISGIEKNKELDPLVITEYEAMNQTETINIDDNKLYNIEFEVFVKRIYKFIMGITVKNNFDEKTFQVFSLDVFGKQISNKGKIKLEDDNSEFFFTGKHFDGTPEKFNNGRYPKSRTLHINGKKLYLDVKNEINKNVKTILRKIKNSNKEEFNFDITFYHNHTIEPSEKNNIKFNAIERKQPIKINNIIYEQLYLIKHGTPTIDSVGTKNKTHNRLKVTY